jgi:hypothetical protein
MTKPGSLHKNPYTIRDLTKSDCNNNANENIRFRATAYVYACNKIHLKLYHLKTFIY